MFVVIRNSCRATIMQITAIKAVPKRNSNQRIDAVQVQQGNLWDEEKQLTEDFLL